MRVGVVRIGWHDELRARALRDAVPPVVSGPAGVTTSLVVRCGRSATPTRDVHAVLAASPASPESGGAGSPGVLLLHGGGGRAFPEWARAWAARGYAALALDLGAPDAVAGSPPPARLDHDDIFDAVERGLERTWIYQAVEACVDAISLLRHLPGVDASAIGVHGISWGGYLATLLAAVDPRVRCAINVYAAGHLARDSTWRPLLQEMRPASAARWIEAFDLSRHVHRIRVPTLWVTGTNDPCYPLDSFEATVDLVPVPVVTRIVPGLDHGHEAAWAVPEPHVFAGSVLRGGPALPVPGPVEVRGDRYLTRTAPAPRLTEAALHLTTDSGRWDTRTWRRLPAEIAGDTVSAHAPGERVTAAFFSVGTVEATTTTHVVHRREPGRRQKGDARWPATARGLATGPPTGAATGPPTGAWAW